MFASGHDLGPLLDVRLRVHWSLGVVIALIVFQLAVGLFPHWHPDWGAGLSTGVAAGAAVVFALSLFTHELVHALTARAVGLPVTSLTLYCFGGVTDITDLERGTDRPGLDALIAAVGPATSALIGAGFISLSGLLSPEPPAAASSMLGIASEMAPLATLFAWIGPINLLIAVFNLLPALPLDGGRILRAFVWWWTDDAGRATRWTAMLARGFSYGLLVLGGLVAFGLYVPYVGAGPATGLWIMFLGWTLVRAATAVYTRQVVSDALDGVQVEQLTDRDVLIVPPETSVRRLVDEIASGRRQGVFPIADDGGFRGIVDLEDLRRIPEPMREQTQLTYTTTPPGLTYTVDSTTPADRALEEMIRRDLEEAVVRHDGEVLGLLHRANILRWARMHASGGDLPPAR